MWAVHFCLDVSCQIEKVPYHCSFPEWFDHKWALDGLVTCCYYTCRECYVVFFSFILLINQENYIDSFSHIKLNLFLCLHIAGFDLLIFPSAMLCLYSQGILACNFLDLLGWPLACFQAVECGQKYLPGLAFQSLPLWDPQCSAPFPRGKRSRKSCWMTQECGPSWREQG